LSLSLARPLQETLHKSHALWCEKGEGSQPEKMPERTGRWSVSMERDQWPMHAKICR